MTESDTSILFDQYHSHLYLIYHLSAFLDQKGAKRCRNQSKKRRKETLGKRFSGSCSERMVRAPGGQRLNHEDCKVAGLQRSRSGEATGTIDQRRNENEALRKIRFAGTVNIRFSALHSICSRKHICRPVIPHTQTGKAIKGIGLPWLTTGITTF